MQDDYLSHYGVMGMKWGVHKEDPSSRFKDKMNRITEDLERKAISGKEARKQGQTLANKYSTEKVLAFSNAVANIGLKYVEHNQFELRETYTPDKINSIIDSLNAKAESYK